MDTMTITVGDFRLVLPSAATVPGVNILPDAIELNFVDFNGKLAILLPVKHSQSLESAPTPVRATQQMSSHVQPDGFPFGGATSDEGEESIHTPMPPSPGRQTFSQLLCPDVSQNPGGLGLTQPLKRCSPPPDLPLAPMWSQLEEAAARGTQPIPRDFSYNNNTPSEVSGGNDEMEMKESTQAPVVASQGKLTFSKDGRLKAEATDKQVDMATEPQSPAGSVVTPKKVTPKKEKKKRGRPANKSPGVKRKRTSPAKAPPAAASMDVEVVEVKDDSEKEDDVPIDLEPVISSAPVKKEVVTTPEQVPAAVANVVNDGKRVRFHAGDAASPTSVAPISIPTRGKDPWTVFAVEAEEEGVEPHGRWGATLTRIDEESALLLGGESDASGFFKEMTHLDLAGRAWNRSRDTPDMIGGGRAWHTTTLVGNCLLVFGGEVERKGDRVQTNDVMFYDTGFFSWYRGQIAGSPPSARGGHAAALIPGTKDLVVFGGISGKRWVGDLHRLSDLATWSVVKGSSKKIKPSARSYASLTTLKECIVLFGGNNKSKSFNDVHLLEKDLTWKLPIVEGRCPKPRTGHSAVATEDGKSVIVYGGWDDQGLHRLFYSDVWKLTVVDSLNCEWKCIYSGDEKSKSPGPRAGAALCAAIGEKAYLFGGWHQISFFNDVLELNTS